MSHVSILKLSRAKYQNLLIVFVSSEIFSMELNLKITIVLENISKIQLIKLTFVKLCLSLHVVSSDKVGQRCYTL